MLSTGSKTTANAGKSGRSKEIHGRLPHPVIDTDGHVIEMAHVLLDYIRELGGPGMADQFRKVPMIHTYHVTNGMPLTPDAAPLMTLDERREVWADRPNFWQLPTANTLDRATGMLPSLMSKRLDEMGIDVTILYPTIGLQCLSIVEDELRQVACRAFNAYYAELLGAYSDRMIPVALIPMSTPEEAISELEHAVGKLGYRAVVMQAWASRPVGQMARKYPELGKLLQRPDLFGLDSAYDYDPVWAKCVELRVAPTFHGLGTGPGVNRRGSISNHLFNNTVIGGFTATAQDICGAILFGGVSHRFPTLNFAFMEGGAAWAAGLLARVVERWERRNGTAMRKMLDPAVLDRKELGKLLREHGDARTVRATDGYLSAFEQPAPELGNIDEFEALQVRSKSDIGARFNDRFYFGCEGDDPTVGLAFQTKALPLGKPLHAVFGSDISHWDVPDMAAVLAETYEAVERGAMSASQFQDFVFTNPVRLHAGMNRNFFRGTRVEAAVERHFADSKSEEMI